MDTVQKHRKLATLLKLHVGLDNDGFIRIILDKVHPIELENVFDEVLPDWEDSGVVVRYTKYIQEQVESSLSEGEKLFNLRNVF